MQVVLKWLAQFLLIPLLKEAAEWVVYKYKKSKERKKLEKENEIKQANYESSNSNSASDHFERLP